MTLQGLPLHAAAGGELSQGQLFGLEQGLEQFRVPGGIAHRPAAGGQGPILPGGVLRHIGEADPKACHHCRQFGDLLLGGLQLCAVPVGVRRICQGIHQRRGVLVRSRGHVLHHILQASEIAEVKVAEAAAGGRAHELNINRAFLCNRSLRRRRRFLARLGVVGGRGLLGFGGLVGFGRGFAPDGHGGLYLALGLVDFTAVIIGVVASGRGARRRCFFIVVGDACGRIRGICYRRHCTSAKAAKKFQHGY